MKSGNNYSKIFLILGYFTLAVFSQSDDFDYTGGNSYRNPPPAILMHKQALTQDGSFNFVFAADNGLKHGETISPNGNRVGAYSYVDPNGETISVKYSAGKDGFKILEGSHVPKTPPHVIQQQREAQQSRYQSPIPPRGILRGEHYGQPEEDVRDIPIPRGPSYPSQSFRSAGPPQHQSAPVHEHYDLPSSNVRVPHSFGKGYSFEFAG